MTRRPDYADRYYSPPSPGWRPRWWNRLACWCDNRLQIVRIWQKLHQLEERQMTTEQEQLDRGRTLIGLVRAEFASLHKQLDEALANNDAEVEAGVSAALGADAAADAERLKGLIDELAEVIPGQVPDVPVPDPGQPAEDPSNSDSGSAPDEPVVES